MPFGFKSFNSIRRKIRAKTEAAMNHGWESSNTRTSSDGKIVIKKIKEAKEQKLIKSTLVVDCSKKKVSAKNVCKRKKDCKNLKVYKCEKKILFSVEC